HLRQAGVRAGRGGASTAPAQRPVAPDRGSRRPRATAPDGEWVKLPGIPRSALVAFVAGSGNVRPILPDLTAPVVRTEQIGPGGTAVQSRRPLDEGDIADLRDDVSSYLTDIGLPDPGVLAS